MNFEEFQNIKEKLYKDFWNLDALTIIPETRQEYEDTLATKIENAHLFRNDYPFESTELILATFKSNFGVKLLSEMKDILNSEETNWDIDKKVRFVKNFFENSYHYFFLITICDCYSRKFINNLYEFWYSPNKAKEMPKDNEGNPWKHKDSVIFGKYWVLLNAPIFDNFPEDIRIVKDIKDYDSHEKLILTESSILIIKKNQDPTIIQMDKFDIIIKYLLSYIKIAIHFYMKLLIEYNFWVLPIIYLANTEKFKKNTIPLELIKQEDKTKARINNLFDEKFQKKIVSIFYLLYEFTNEKIWTIIIEEEELINKFLEKDNLTISKAKIDETRDEIKKSNLKMIAIVIKKIKEFLYKEEYDIEKAENEIMNDFDTLINRIIKNGPENFDTSILLFGFILAGYIIINPLAILKDNLSKMIIEQRTEK